MMYSGGRTRPPMKRPVWIIVLVCLVSMFVISAYIYDPRNSAGCYLFSSGGCASLGIHHIGAVSRALTDDEMVVRAVMNEILRRPPLTSNIPKIAFMFLTPATIPFEPLWDIFFHGHEDRFSVYVHAPKEPPAHVSRYFVGRYVRTEKVEWGKISMVDAEKRLLANALLDPDNQQFVLLSDSCVPLHSFDYIYNYLLFTNVSFIDSFEDPGPLGNGRYSEHMLPEVEKKDFRKGAQWFAMKRQHAIIVMVDSLYYRKFKLYCRPNMDGRNCYSNEHYLPTLFHMIDPGGIANWSVTHVDWSEGKWQPRAYRAHDVTQKLLKNISSIDETVHVTSEAKKKVMVRPCLWNGKKRPCYLFARRFYPEAQDRLTFLLSNYTTV